MKEVIYTKNPKIGAGQVIFIAALALALTGPAASKESKIADINERFPFQLTIENAYADIYTDTYTSAPTIINLAGEAHFRSLLLEDESGTQHLTGHSNIHLSGEDTTGLQYILNIESNIEEKFPIGVPMTIISTYKLNSQGSADNCYLKVQYHVSPSGEVKSEFEPICQS